MADIADVNFVLPVKLLLERKNHDHLADIFLDLLHPARAPGPYLRADEVKHRNAQPVQLARQTQVEVREVNEHGSIRLAPRGFRHQMLEAPPDIRQVLHYFHQSDHRDLISMYQQLAAGSSHLFAAHAEEACAGRKLP